MNNAAEAACRAGLKKASMRMYKSPCPPFSKGEFFENKKTLCNLQNGTKSQKIQ
jgi:hypothetical protein